MKRPNREFSIFTLSAMDVLAMATGTFVLIVVILMPYYRKTFHANAELEGIRVAAATSLAEVEALQRQAESARAAADETAQRAASLESTAAELERIIITQEDDSKEAKAKAADAAKRIAEMEELVEQRVVEELDLVFVIDTTRSMGPALRELALSMRSIVRILERLVPSLRIGFVSYRDRDTGLPPLRVFPLTPTKSSLSRVLNFAADLNISPRPSRTPQEDVFLGLNRAFSMNLRPGAKQTIILMGDAAAHDWEQRDTLRRVRQFVNSGKQRSVSALFMNTPSYQRFGSGDRAFFQNVARTGRGAFNDHAGQMIESVLLSVLVE